MPAYRVRVECTIWWQLEVEADSEVAAEAEARHKAADQWSEPHGEGDLIVDWAEEIEPDVDSPAPV